MAKDVKFNIKLNVDGKNVVVSASTNVKQLADNLGLVKDNVSAADKEFMRWTQSVMALDSVTNSLRQISDVLNTITEDSRSFGAAMKAANTMAGKNAEGFNRLKGQVAELSKTVPLARDELAKGLYQVISNGVPENNWISYLQASSKAAVGGIANLEEVVKVTSTVIKNYGLEWSAAEDIQDKIQLTAKNGVTSFEQLAAALPSVTGQAAQLGVSFTEMLAVMATLTGVTGNTADVSTQLASVLTALTKESSKSQKMAQEMGISFDAASIKAAGGLRNFLQELDKTITAYSQKTGELKESIYSKLFGRAEALRLVNALTGNLAAKFDENIKALDNSAGTIDKAFDEMSSTGSATTQMLKNQAAKFQDVISSVIGAVQPYLNFTTQMGITTLSIMNLSKALKGLHIMQKIAAVPTKLMSVAMLLCGLRGTRAAAGVRVFSAALKGVAYSSTAAKLALRGLLISTGVGAAIAALTFVVEKLIDAFDHTGDAADDAVNSIDTVGESAKSAQQAFTSAQSETYSRLMTKYTELQKSWKALTSAHAKAQWIKSNAEAFGELGLKVDSVKSAEQVFSENTGAVVQSFVARAKAAARLAQLTEEYRIQMDLADKIGRANDAAQARHTVKTGDKVSDSDGFAGNGGHTTEGGYEYVGQNGNWQYTEKGAARHNANRWVANTSQDKQNRRALAESQRRTRQLEADIAADKKSLKPLNPSALNTPSKTTKAKKSSTASVPVTVDFLWKENLKETEESIRKELGEGRYDSLDERSGKKEQPLMPLSSDLGPGKKVMSEWNAYTKAVNEAAKKEEEFQKKMSDKKSVTDSIASIANSFVSLGQTIGGVGGNMIQTIGQLAATAASAISQLIALAAAQGMSNAFKLPFPGNLAAWATVIGAVVSGASTIAGLAKMKFANGGLAYGPTLGLVGEYPGASNNPEVIAPLDKLRSIIQPVSAAPLEGNVVFRIKGRALEGVLERRMNYNSRT